MGAKQLLVLYIVLRLPRRRISMYCILPLDLERNVVKDTALSTGRNLQENCTG